MYCMWLHPNVDVKTPEAHRSGLSQIKPAWASQLEIRPERAHLNTLPKHSMYGNIYILIYNIPTLTPETTLMYVNMPCMECLGYSYLSRVTPTGNTGNTGNTLRKRPHCAPACDGPGSWCEPRRSRAYRDPSIWLRPIGDWSAALSRKLQKRSSIRRPVQKPELVGWLGTIPDHILYKGPRPVDWLG